MVGPPKDDICYATTNRQAAVKSLAREVDLVLVIGSANSSNSQRLVDVTRDLGVQAHLIDDESQSSAAGSRASRPSASRPGRRPPSGSSSARGLVPRARLEEVAEHHLIEENVHFALPRGVREAQPTG